MWLTDVRILKFPEIFLSMISDTEREKLTTYTGLMKTFVDSPLSNVYPIGWKRYPREAVKKAERLRDEKSVLERQLGLAPFSSGRWELYTEGSAEGMANNDKYRKVLPLVSDNHEYLEFILQTLAETFRGQRLRIRDLHER